MEEEVDDKEVEMEDEEVGSGVDEPGEDVGAGCVVDVGLGVGAIADEDDWEVGDGVDAVGEVLVGVAEADVLLREVDVGELLSKVVGVEDTDAVDEAASEVVEPDATAVLAVEAAASEILVLVSCRFTSSICAIDQILSASDTSGSS